jgi:glycosyltransferase involved in cell wall biosynthesis
MITIFTPSFADEANTNAQNLTAKEVVSRLPSDRFKVVLLGDGKPDPRILARKNTEIWRYSRHGNTARWFSRLLLSKIDIYFFPRRGPLDLLFLAARRIGLRISLVTYVLTALNEIKVDPAWTRLIREADQVVGNSRFVSKTVRDRFGVECQTIPDGISHQWFHPPDRLRQPGPKLTVLYAGSFQPMKRAEVVIREAAKYPAAEFRLAGQGREEETCRSLANELGCRNVTFLGHLPQVALADEMRKADIFFFPSILEGHPQVLGQAAACGLPAIAMNNYRPDYVVNGETGYLVESESDLSTRLGLLLVDHDMRLKMSTAAAHHILQFDWDVVAKDWESVFLEVVAKSGRKIPTSQPLKHRTGD